MAAERDIAFQLPVELQIATSLAREFGGMVKPNGAGKVSEKDFEIWVPRGVEVKCDYKAKTTRNLYFETHNCYRNKPSGLTATKADWWVHYVPGDGTAYRYPPKRMLAWLGTQTTYRKLEKCGDNNSDGYIVPVAVVAALDFVKSFPIML